MGVDRRGIGDGDAYGNDYGNGNGNVNGNGNGWIVVASGGVVAA